MVFSAYFVRLTQVFFSILHENLPHRSEEEEEEEKVRQTTIRCEYRAVCRNQINKNEKIGTF